MGSRNIDARRVERRDGRSLGHGQLPDRITDCATGRPHLRQCLIMRRDQSLPREVPQLHVARRPSGYTRREAARSVSDRCEETAMRLKVVVHEADEGGFWAEVPAIPGCATQGETFEELLANLYEAVEGCLSVDVVDVKTGANDRVMDIAI